MKTLIWVLPLLGSIAAILVFILLVQGKKELMDIAFSATIAAATAIIPYVLARSVSELSKNN